MSECWKRKDSFKFFKTGEMKVETIKNAENWRSKRRKLKEHISDGLDLLREESNKNSGTYVQEFLLHVYLEVKREKCDWLTMRYCGNYFLR